MERQEDQEQNRQKELRIGLYLFVRTANDRPVMIGSFLNLFNWQRLEQ
jgi:hypothetical protein